jgi:lysine 2,3-aminomutase
VRDVVVSGGDVANMPWKNLESFLDRLLEIDNIRDIRLATKALMGLPQHWLAEDVVEGVGGLRPRPASAASPWRSTHMSTAPSRSPPLWPPPPGRCSMPVCRDVRNQGVLLRGTNDSVEQLLDLCFALQDEASITPYYFYMCDMIPFAEHWRLSLAEAQRLQHDIMGYLPGFATPRVVCDVPFVGKRWVHQVDSYNTERGMSFWRKNYRTSIERRTPSPVARVRLLRPHLHPPPGRSGLVARAGWARGGSRHSRGQGRSQPAGLHRPARLSSPPTQAATLAVGAWLP